MNSPLNNKLNKISLFTNTLLFVATFAVGTSVALAGDENIAYVDSVQSWGAWGLDIEPAAGGLSQPTTQALNARSSRVALRTNSIAALAPPASAKSPVIFTAPTAPIVPPVVPVSPPPPPVTPPIGGPTDGLF